MTPTHTGINVNVQQTGYSGQTNLLPRLKPCPFCGNDHPVSWIVYPLSWYLKHHTDRPWMVECLKCRAQGPHAATDREARELWNKR